MRGSEGRGAGSSSATIKGGEDAAAAARLQRAGIRPHNQYTSAEKCSHSLSSVFTTCLWNTGKSTLSCVLSPDPRLDRSLPNLTEGFCRFYSD